MIANPFINKGSGEIKWFQEGCPSKQCPETGYWQSYASFEREKLKELGEKSKLGFSFQMTCDNECLRKGSRNKVCFNGYKFRIINDGECEPQCYTSDELIGYGYNRWLEDSESNRLLKRSEFLRAVCKAENIEWLPNEFNDCDRIIEDNGAWISTEEVKETGRQWGLYDDGYEDGVEARTHKKALVDKRRKQKEFNMCNSCDKAGKILEGLADERREQAINKGLDKLYGEDYGFPREEEKEWRRELLDYLRDHTMQDIGGKHDIEGLRKRYC